VLVIQVFERKDTLLPNQLSLLKRLRQFASLFALTGNTNRSSSSAHSETEGLAELRRTFCGFHADMLSSLILSSVTAATATVDLPAKPTNNSSSASNNSSSSSSSKLSTSDASAKKGLFTIPTDDELSHTLDTHLEETLFQDCVRRLLWIAAPEATCRLLGNADWERQISREFGIDCRKIYFKEQRHSSLSGFIEQFNRLEDELGTLAVVMTYSPLSQEAVKSFNRKSGKTIANDQTGKELNVTHVVLHELDQERSLRQSVNEFFKNAQPGSTLLVQCDPLATSKRRIEHTKFILESARSKFLKSREAISRAQSSVNVSDAEIVRDPDAMVIQESQQVHPAPQGIHVVLLLHLPRGEAEGDQRYCVDFDTRWSFAFVDSIVAADSIGLPDVELMIGKNLIDVMGCVDMKKALIKSFRTSLAKLTYSSERTNEDVRHQIVTILRCLESPAFVSSINSVLLAMQAALQEKFAMNKKDFELGSEAVEDHLLLLTGTFQGALHMQILNTIADSFAIILSHIDRNSSLSLWLNPEFAALWEYLFKISFNPSTALTFSSVGSRLAARNVKGSGTAGATKRVNKDTIVKTDGFDSCPFDARFPFSFYLCPLIDSMRKIAEHAPEYQLRGQFSTLGLELNLDKPLDTKLIQNYLYDIVCMKCRPLTNVSRVDQTRLVNFLLEMACDQVGATRTGAIPASVEADAMVVEENSTSASSSSAFDERELCYLTSIHHRWWRIERIVDLYCELLNVLPTAVAPILQCVVSQHNQHAVVDAALHKRVLDVCLATLEPWEGVYWKNSSVDSWLLTLDSARPHINSLVDLMASADALSSAVRRRWLRLEFFKSFVQNVAVPLEMDVAVLRKHLQLYANEDLCTHESLCITVSLLCSLNTEMMREEFGQHSDFICGITLQRMVDPVIAADGFTYERSAITEWFAKGKVTSPCTNQVLSHTMLRPNTELRERLDALTDCNLSHFLEYFVFEVLLAELQRRSPLTKVDTSGDIVELQLFYDIIGLAAGMLPIDAGSLQLNTKLSILPSAAAATGMIREIYLLLNQNSNNSFAQPSSTKMRSRLGETVFSRTKAAGYCDVPLSLSYVTVQEEKFSVMLRQNPLLMSSQQMFINLNPDDKTNVLESLDNIAMIRSELAAFGEVICQLSSSTAHQEQEMLYYRADALNNSVAQFLARFGEITLKVGQFSNAATVRGNLLRSMKIFLMKQIERSKGVSFLRNALQEPPLATAEWVKAWKLAGDVPFTRFLGSNKVINIKCALL
jgi:hypothetical protein